LKVDILQDMFWSIKLNEEHNEDAVVGQLLEFPMPHLMVLQKDTSHNAKHLQGIQS
jgi:hypothetical protein